MEGKERNHLVGTRSRELLPPGTLQCATSCGSRNPFLTKASSADFLTLDDLQSDIFAPDRKRISEFLSSPSLTFPFYPRNIRASQERSRQEGERKAAAEEEQAKERDKTPLTSPT